MDAFIQYGIAAGMQAMQDAGLDITEAKRQPHWSQRSFRIGGPL